MEHGSKLALETKRLAEHFGLGRRFDVNLKAKRRSVKNSDERQIFLPNKGFKGILAALASVAAVFRRMELGGNGAGHTLALHRLEFFVPRQSF